MGGVEPDALFGPLETTGAANDLLAALLQTAVLCGLFWWLLRSAGSDVRWVRLAALLLSAADLAVANRWMVVTAPSAQWLQPSELAAVLRREEAEGDRQPYRVLRHPGWIPPPWEPEGPPKLAAEATRRMSQAMRWDLDTLWPKYNLTERIPLADVQGAMMPHDYELFLNRGQSPFSPTERVTVPRLLAKYVILPGDDVLPAAEPVDVEVRGISLWHNPRHLPRAWIVHQVEVLPPVATAPTAGESCRVLHYDPLRVKIEAELTRPGLVVLCDQFYPGWRLEVETAGQAPQEVPILRANRVMRGAWLPAGTTPVGLSIPSGEFRLRSDHQHAGVDRAGVGGRMELGWKGQGHVRVAVDPDYARIRPEGGPDYERSLTKWMDDESERQIAALKPTDAKSLEKYREIVGGAIDVIMGRKLPSARSIVRKQVAANDRDGYTESKELIRNTRHGEELPVILPQSKIAPPVTDGGGCGLLPCASGQPRRKPRGCPVFS